MAFHWNGAFPTKKCAYETVESGDPSWVGSHGWHGWWMLAMEAFGVGNFHHPKTQIMAKYNIYISYNYIYIYLRHTTCIYKHSALYILHIPFKKHVCITIDAMFTQTHRGWKTHVAWQWSVSTWFLSRVHDCQSESRHFVSQSHV